MLWKQKLNYDFGQLSASSEGSVTSSLCPGPAVGSSREVSRALREGAYWAHVPGFQGRSRFNSEETHDIVDFASAQPLARPWRLCALLFLVGLAQGDLSPFHR